LLLYTKQSIFWTYLRKKKQQHKQTKWNKHTNEQIGVFTAERSIKTVRKPKFGPLREPVMEMLFLNKD